MERFPEYLRVRGDALGLGIVAFGFAPISVESGPTRAERFRIWYRAGIGRIRPISVKIRPGCHMSEMSAEIGQIRPISPCSEKSGPNSAQF